MHAEQQRHGGFISRPISVAVLPRCEFALLPQLAFKPQIVCKFGPQGRLVPRSFHDMKTNLHSFIARLLVSLAMLAVLLTFNCAGTRLAGTLVVTNLKDGRTSALPEMIGSDIDGDSTTFSPGDQTIIALLFFIAGVAGSLFWQYSLSLLVLEKWAARNRYEILERQCRSAFEGAFFWTSSCQAVFYVKVRDQTGQVRTGWVQCGGWFRGLSSDAAKVQWED